jgi:hypothetical protein
MAVHARTPLQPAVVFGLVCLALLTLLLFGLRGVLLQPTQTLSLSLEHHHAGSSHTQKPHQHQEHCPLCFLLLLPPHLAPVLDRVWTVSFIVWLWIGESYAKDAFLRAITARGPPQLAR